jgi:hypothetical protein
MSYDISLVKRGTNEPVHFTSRHQITGGTYAVGGTTEAWLNVTYNYAPFFYKHLGENGIRSIYGKTPAESVRMLNAAIQRMQGEPSADYWAATEGNARAALVNLLVIASKAVAENIDCEWSGD